MGYPLYYVCFFFLSRDLVYILTLKALVDVILKPELIDVNWLKPSPSACYIFKAIIKAVIDIGFNDFG